jgi:hypothetical protein
MPDDELCRDVKRHFSMKDDDIRMELIVFRAYHAAAGSFSANWRASFVTWCKRWREYKDKHASPQTDKFSPLPRDPRLWTREQWQPIVRFYARTKHWPAAAGADPESPACCCPREILEFHRMDSPPGT